MITVNYELFSDIDKCDDLIKNIYIYGRDLVTAFKSIEFNIAEARDLKYIVLISENQRDIFLKHIDPLIEIYLRLRKNSKIYSVSYLFFHGLKELFDLEDMWQRNACEYLFSSIFNIFYTIDEGKTIFCYNDAALYDVTIIVKNYLAYLGKEDKLEEAMKNVKEMEDCFYCENDIIYSLEIDNGIIVPKGLKMPKTIKYEVRREINGVFYAIASEESAQKLFKLRKELVKLAYDNYGYMADRAENIKQIRPIVYERLWRFTHVCTVGDIIINIIVLAQCIAGFQKHPDSKHMNVTGRHLEEIHILAQECLKIKFFDLHYANFSKEITDSSQLAQLIDSKLKTLDPPTGSRTKPAIREVCE